MGLRFPGARTPDEFWRLVQGGIDAGRDVPPDRWPVPKESVVSATIGAADKVPSARGYFVDAEPLDLAGLPGVSDGTLDDAWLKALDPSIHLALLAGRDALADTRGAIDRTRAAAIIGHIALPTERSSRLTTAILGATFADRALGLPVALPPLEPVDNRVTALPAALLAAGLGFGGGSFTLDAACASTLYALKLAADALVEGRAEAVLAGGLSRPDPFYTQMGFAQLRALSPSGRSYPFDERAAGLVVGEGVGLFVLKRLMDAERDGDRIYGVLAGFGLSQDRDGSIMAPSTEGQLRAMRAAYADSGWRPQAVDMIECHATSTPVGDKVEVTSLRELWQPDVGGTCVLSSVKANVGHLLTAAGAASLAKVLLAMRATTLPPTANFASTAAGVLRADSPFRILSAPQPWVRRDERTPRRAAISGFGFGGINAHVLVEEWLPGQQTALDGQRSLGRPRLPFVAGAPFVASTPQGKPQGTPQGMPQDEREVAIVGVAVHFAPETEEAAWWGAQSAAWYKAAFQLEGLKAAPTTEIEISPNAFRIPPLELRDMLPQQLLMLTVAADAMRDVTLDNRDRDDAGVFIGLGLDAATNLYSGRWTLATTLRRIADEHALDLSDAEITTWADASRDAYVPPLTPNRVMGSLAGVVASRVARAHGFGGQSFTVSNEEASGLRALALAAAAIQRGELRMAIAGAVDTAGSLVAAVSERLWRERYGGDVNVTFADAAVALVLKNAETARRDGDRILAFVGDFVAGLDDSARDRSRILRAGSLPVGTETYYGAATGLVAAARAVGALSTHVANDETGAPRYWLRNRAAGPRCADIVSRAADGNTISISLRESDDAQRGRARLGVGHDRFALFLLEGATNAELEASLRRLRALVEERAKLTPSTLATLWAAEPRPSGRWRCAILHERSRSASLKAQIDKAIASAHAGLPSSAIDREAGVFIGSEPLPATSLAFVFPGSGSYYEGMGREMAAAFPGVVDAQDAATLDLKDQFGAAVFWGGLPRVDSDPSVAFGFPGMTPTLSQPTILAAQCSLACLAADVLALAGVRPGASIGYSLGESAALLALGGWTDRQAVYDRLKRSTIFTDELAGPMRAVRRHWRLGADEPITWVNFVVRRTEDAVRAAMSGLERVYCNNVNTPGECIIGGDRDQALTVLQRLDHPPVAVPTMAALHCPVVLEIAEEFRAFHEFPLAPPPGVVFYSGASGEPLALSGPAAADSILRHAVEGVNVPKMVERAYTDGVRVFLELGPGATMSRMIKEIIGDRPHRTMTLCARSDRELASVYATIGELWSVGLAANAEVLISAAAETSSVPTMRITTASRSFGAVPPRPRRSRAKPSAAQPAAVVEAVPSLPQLTNGQPDVARPHYDFLREAVRQFTKTQMATAAAHVTHLRATQTAIEGGCQLLLAVGDQPSAFLPAPPELRPPHRPALREPQTALRPAHAPLNPEPPWLDYAKCHEYAVGSIANVLGPDFAAADEFPTRVRLPDGPLLLCHRIMSVDAVPMSMSSGTLITEHDVFADAWYLDGGRIPSCIAIEAGQADLFLSGYLGADFHTRGLAMYRLLDAVVTFHDRLPTPGSVIRYVIRIHEFFRQDETLLFRFGFDATVDGRRLMTMESGIAGFFSAQELAAGKGLVARALDNQQRPGRVTGGFTRPVPMTVESYDEAALDALRRGDYAACFGPAFAGLELQDAKRLPGGDQPMLRLVHRIPTLEPDGGRFGLGHIVGEADVSPDDWFLTCHFVDDMVMPGTLMYECCLHTLRVFLMRMGWVGERDTVPCEPKPGVASRLKCRGQVLQSTRTVRYEIELKEIGYDPDAYALADARMYADGKAIVEIHDISIRHRGLTKEAVERLWTTDQPRAPKYDRAQILALAEGKPSDAFGPGYARFDEPGRRVARLPRPPFSFLDRITETGTPLFEMRAGGEIVAEYDVPSDAWYFDTYGANRQMPLAVLCEAALQPCGWYSAYMGAALVTDDDLYYRNLNGVATLHAQVAPSVGTLRTRVKCTGVSRSGSMIIHNFVFAMTSADRSAVYDGTTVFGFFTRDALANQVGLRCVAAGVSDGSSAAFKYPNKAHLPRAPILMVDEVVSFDSRGGQMGLGRVHGRKRIDPTEWFFAAHFLQDPVMPGSLGLEAFQQLLLLMADERWPGPAYGPVPGERHEWTYRGQVLPTSGSVDVVVEIAGVDEERRVLTGRGVLSVDGLAIYEVKGFTVGAVQGAIRIRT
jgi:acyl transferase domain-containing protein/3-hydroxymyristoyl/3-hydroxydecanoyl-(acyl carrier protein) dehydratase